MMKLTCVIIDDEPLAQELLKRYIEKTPFLQLAGCYSSAVEAMTYNNMENVDLVFLDIQMPELDGLEFSKMIPRETRVVFVTAFNQYALDGYRVNALDYLLKPVSYKDFLEASQKALRWFELTRGHTGQTQQSGHADSSIDCIYVKSEYKLVQIKLADILYIEGLKDYIKIFVEGNSKPILSLISMKTMEERLPYGKFIRVHRSFIVQKSKIKVIERSRIVFGDVYIPVSDSYKQEWLNFLNERSL